MDVSKIAHELAEKYNIRKSAVDQIIHSQFSYVRKVINDGKFENVILYKFGKFAVKPHKIKILELEAKSFGKTNERQTREDIKRMEKSNMGEQRDRDTSSNQS